MKQKKRNKKKRIGVLTQNRGVSLPPTRADENKKKKNDRRKQRQKQKSKIKRGDYDV
ncbi:hypothetical protein PQE70_gp067 [Bacillus phage vB_BanS_Nate]|uniref:Uncharacterized protein n=1 Tax=Bacillus phage vB_BanS_Nate TaxID=2894788 RepID=A0AAE8YV53_9CAUD|nr:hypothetical protein PQE70_gp067 [Bacillus phage vB_BanS_Nate]UGO50920.1 hypothetical protein NATE_67 [Bacillus phage vB_BanS_Nate]